MAGIGENVADGSIIFTDCKSGYKINELRDTGFQRFTVNHKHNFVDRNTRYHIQLC